MSDTQKHLDPFTAKAENTDISISEKIAGYQKIAKDAKVGMLTSRAVDGSMHSRAMHPTPFSSATQINLFFIANNASHKFPEIEQDSHVNVSFYDTHMTSWASVSGCARVSQDKGLIHQHWSHGIGAYFGDLKDGVHKGDQHDPRVAVIEVIPDEIRYFVATQGSMTRAINTTVSAAMGRVSTPGEIRTITKDEIRVTDQLHSV